MTQIAMEMRAAITDLAGERSWTETRQRWLERAARAAGISFRAAKTLFYCEDREPRASTVEKVRRAVEARRKEEVDARADTRDILDRLASLEARLASIDPEFHREQIEGFRAATPASRSQTD